MISAVKYGGDAYRNGDQLLVKLGPQIIHKFNSGGTTNSGSDPSIRDVYDNPDDLYEENWNWFDDEEEAWDYWYEDRVRLTKQTSRQWYIRCLLVSDLFDCVPQHLPEQVGHALC